MRIVIKATMKSPTLKLQQAIARGLNEGGDLTRTQVRRTLKAVTNVKAYKSITSRTEQSGKGGNRAAPGRLRYAVCAPRRAIPIKEFPVSVKTGRGGGVDAKSWGVDHLFKRSFQVNGKLMARRGGPRLPIRSLKGPNLGKELVKGRPLAVFHATVAATVPPAVLKHIVKAL